MKLLRIIFILLVVFSVNISYSMETEKLTSLHGVALQGSFPKSMSLQDDNYGCITTSTCSPAIDLFKSRFYMKLWYGESEGNHYNSSWNVNVNYTITLFDVSGNPLASGPMTHTLTIDYNPTAGSTYTDIDFELYNSQNVIKAEVRINSVTHSFGTMPDDIHLDLVYESTQYKAMDVTHAPILNTPSYDATKAELTLTWPYIIGAESYDVEWLFIDIGDDVAGAGIYEYDFKNASRINTSSNSYTLSMAYPRGYFLFRARAVQTKQTTSGNIRIEGNWTSPQKGSTSLSALGGGFSPWHYYYQSSSLSTTSLPPRPLYYYAGLESTRNWQYSVTYAEEGKRKEAISYFDGTLRNRQQVTVSSTDDRAVVGETIYDYVGRPAVNTLPAPQITNKGMHYYPNQNMYNTSTTFNYNHFDTNGVYNNPTIIDTNVSKGSAYYYSKSNNSPFGINDQYIPTANGFSYTRTQYKNDGTNRIKKQSGVGKKHRTGGDRETVYLFSKPTQEELDRLFGNEAGYANMYKKNAIVDPNGQANITYIDNHGRTIATALSGDVPENLIEIDTKPSSFDYITTNLSLTNRLDKRGRMVVSSTISITSGTTVEFTYQLNDSSFYQSCLDKNIGCYYDYEIYITNEYGSKVNFVEGGNTRTGTGVTGVPTPITFSTYLPIGSYQIHKILSVNDSIRKSYLDELMNINYCLKVNIDSVTTCNPSCEEVCWSGYVSINVNGDTTYLQDDGKLIAVIDSNGLIKLDSDGNNMIGSHFSNLTEVQDSLTATRAKVALCIEQCDDLSSTPILNPCELKYEVLKADMSPGGQYFDALDAHGLANGWLINNIGITPPGCMNSNWDDTRAGWQDSWGDILVSYHPEWCAYQKECCPVEEESCSGSNTIVTTITQNFGEGICDITFLQDSVNYYLDNYLGSGYSASSLFSDIAYPTSPSYPTTNPGIDSLLHLLYNPINGVISVQKVMTGAEFLQATADFYEELVKYRYIKSECTPSLYLSGKNGITVEGFHIRYPKNPVFESFTTPYNAVATQANMGTQSSAICSDKAQELTDEFMASFVCKDTMLPLDTSALRTAILNKANQNCTNNDPVETGLNTTVINFLTSLGYPVACMTGNWFDGVDEQCKCDNLFTFLADANGVPIHRIVMDPVYGNSPNASVISSLESILSYNDSVNGVTSGNLSAWYSNCNNSPYFIGSPIPEYFLCYSDSLPTDTNACVTAINELAYQNELARIKAQVLDSLTVFKNRYDSSCLGNIMQRETFTMKYLLQEYHYTLYYYDQAGNLIKTVPPEGLYQKDKFGNEIHNSILDKTDLALTQQYREGTNSTFIRPAHLMATNYRYNSLNQLTSQYTPDGDSSHFFYDALGRLVASQNAEQLPRNAYSYTEFDELGRMIEVGEMDNATNLTEVTARDTTEYLEGYSGANQFYAWLNVNASKKHQLVNTYYDKQYTSILPTATLTQKNLRNRIATVTYDKDGDGMRESATHYTYDINGNVNTLLQENRALINVAGVSGSGHEYKRIDYEYDLVSGNVNKVSYQAGEDDEFYHKYEYDADNRLTVAYTSRNNVIWEKESKNFYYAHGSLARTEIGDRQVQAQDYVYTLQGWLKTINSSMGHQDRDIGQDGVSGTMNENFGRDVYGFSLHYYRGDYQAKGSNNPTVNSTIMSYGTGDFNDNVVDLYNGNISAMVVGLTRHDNSRAQVIGNTYRYDQLNRIKEYTPFLGEEVGHVGEPYQENTMDPTKNVNQRYNTTYTYDGNGNIETLNRKGSEFIPTPGATNPDDIMGVPVEMDDFTYEYQNKNGSGAKINNRLDYVNDEPSYNTNYTNDLDQQQFGNYKYDNLGRLIGDATEKIDLIVWNVANKITRIEKDGGNQIIEFEYDPLGNRISKKDIIPSGEVTTFYVRDAQGKVIATYKENSRIDGNPFVLNDMYIYGSSRLGTKQEDLVLIEHSFPVINHNLSHRKLGNKRYELSNHLGNVLQVISDRKLSYDDGGGKTDYFEADVVSYSDYYPFGMLQPNRHGQDDSYRYGFNGMEKDDEIRGTKGASYDYGARMLDVRIGRWLSVDPLESKFPYSSPYVFVLNLPTNAVDPDGQDIIVLTASSGAGGLGHGSVLIGNDKDGWTFISKDGTYGSSSSNNNSTGPPTKNKATEKFGSLDEFLKSSHNNHEGKPYYDGAYLIKNTESSLHKDNGGKLSSDEIDKKMIDAGAAQKAKTYIVTSQSCIDVVSDALDAGGHHPGTLGFWASVLDIDPTNRIYWGKNHMGYHINRIPNTRKKRIWKKNKGTKLSTGVDEETKKKFKKDYEDSSKTESEVSTPETESSE